MLKTDNPQKVQVVNNINQMHLNVPSETPIVDFLTNYGPKLLYALLGLMVLFFFVYRYSSNKKADSITDYLNADVYFQRFVSSPEPAILADNEAYVKLTDIMNRHPELNAKYDGDIAQALLERNQIAEAKVYADRVFKRVASEDVNDYISFSQASLLISENQPKQALESAKALQQTMKSQIDAKGPLFFGPALFAFNELRIATLAPSQTSITALQKQLVDSTDSKTSNDTLVKKGYRQLQEHFNNGTTNLSNYIEMQKKNVKS